MRPALVLVFGLALAAPAQSQDVLLFARGEGLFNQISTQVLVEAYQSIGIRVDTQTLPAERALATSNSGEADGEVNRIAGIEKTYPNLIMVPVAVNFNEPMAFVKNKTFAVTGWESLKPYRLSFRLGIKLMEQGTMGMDVVPNVTSEQCFKMLDLGRVDVVIETEPDGVEALNNLKLDGITMLRPALASARVYHYLHKKHADLVPRITDALRIMEASGRIAEIREQMIAKQGK